MLKRLWKMDTTVLSWSFLCLVLSDFMFFQAAKAGIGHRIVDALYPWIGHLP
jgi:hypothetical protein